jgi:branched-chain amino acid aminotransferase
VKQLCYIEGKITSADEPCLPADDLGLQRGYAVFDYVRVYKGKLFHMRDHLARLRRSGDAMHLVVPYTDDEILSIAQTLVKRLGLDNQGLRMILTGGPAHTQALFEKPRLVLVAEELPVYPSEAYERGVKLLTCEFQREIPHVKTTNYVTAFRLAPLKKEKGAFELLYTWQGKVLECARDSFFIVRGDTLAAPEEYVLESITRKVIVEMVKGRFKVEGREISVDELDSVDEAFLASTSKQIVPVVQVDDRRIGNGSVGKHTRTIMGLFDDYIERYEPR